MGYVGVVLQCERWNFYTALGHKYRVADKEVLRVFLELVQQYLRHSNHGLLSSWSRQLSPKATGGLYNGRGT